MIMDSLDSFTGIASIGAIIATVVAGWSQIKSALGWVMSIAVDRVVVDKTSAQIYCTHKANFLFPPSRNYIQAYMYINGMVKTTALRAHLDDIAVVVVGARVMVRTGKTFWFIRGTVNADKLATDLVNTHQDVINLSQGQTRFMIRTLTGGGSFMRSVTAGSTIAHPTIPQDSMDSPLELDAPYTHELVSINDRSLLYFKPLDTAVGYIQPPEAETIIKQLQKWLTNKEWYHKRGTTWRRGFLLSGPAGTGKSSLVLNVARKLDLPVYIFDLASMNNEEFGEKWDFAMCRTPCIVLVEDIDAIFNGRVNVIGQAGGGLTFDCLLNTLSGASDADGIIFIATSNYPEKLDEALIRPGRIDEKIEVGPMPLSDMERLAAVILENEEDREFVLNKFDRKPTVAAVFKEACVHKALERFACTS